MKRRTVKKLIAFILAMITALALVPYAAFTAKADTVYYVRTAFENVSTQKGQYATFAEAKTVADNNCVYGYQVFDNTGTFVYASFSQISSIIMREAKWVCDYVRDNGFTYGDAPINPAIDCSAKRVSCDRLVAWALYRAGFTNQPRTQGLVVYDGSGTRDLTTWCMNNGFIRITSVAAMQPGDVVFVNPATLSSGNVYPSHTFLFAGHAGNGTYYRYDGGSNTRIRSTQPSVEALNNFMYAYRPVASSAGSALGKYVVTGADGSLNVRQNPDASSALLTSIPNGTEFIVTEINGNWGKSTVNGVTGWLSLQYAVKAPDAEKPVVSNAKVSNITNTGYTVTCDISDDVGVVKVMFPSWSKTKSETATWLQGNVNGKTASCRIEISMINNLYDDYMTHIYAYDGAGNQSNGIAIPSMVTIENTLPVISEAKVSDITSDGYTVTCKVTDNVGIATVQFPTWTEKDGQDDLAENWNVNEAVKGTKSGDTYSFRVKISDHNNERGAYITHIYAYDFCGNVKGDSSFGGITVPGRVVLPALKNTSALKADDKYITGVKEAATAQSVIDEFDSAVKIFNVTAELPGTDSVATGYVVAFNSTPLYSIVIKGDVDGDGKVTMNDYNAIKIDFKTEKSSLKGAYFAAADIRDDGKITTTDYLMIKRHISSAYKLF